MAELNERVASLEARMDAVEDDISCLNKIERLIERITTLLEVESGKGEKRDRLIEQQSNTLAQQNITLVKINDSLKNLNEEIKNTNKRIDTLEKIVTVDEEKNKIDLRDVKKEEVKETLGQRVKKAAVPFTAVSALLVALFELIRSFVTNK